MNCKLHCPYCLLTQQHPSHHTCLAQFAPQITQCTGHHCCILRLTRWTPRAREERGTIPAGFEFCRDPYAPLLLPLLRPILALCWGCASKNNGMEADGPVLKEKSLKSAVGRKELMPSHQNRHPSISLNKFWGTN